ncbi:two-component system response regulator YesN [Anaerotaenia torta]|uniref:response regulator n=1 Tax=Anaerotaenia torta TaxID=433293 RepID=UPI003D1E5086
MYKVFLVEDEFVVREGIKNNIHWEEEGFRIVGDESDGELAYPMILREQPDILITDIKMPFMNGLELSKLLKKELPQLKIIIISGYSDFGYAQQAIDIGITEYLLKPVTSDKLMTAVKNAAAVIEKERKDQQILEEYQLLIYQQQGKKRKDFFNALVSGNMTLSQIIQQEEELGINMVASAFRIMLFQFKAQEDMYEYSNEVVQCEGRMQEVLREYSGIKVFERSMDGWAFILLGENEEQIEALTRELCKLLREISGGKVHYFGGIGRVVHRVRDLRQSFLDANRAFSPRYFERGDQFLFYSDVRNIKDQIGKWSNVRELNLEKLDRSLLDDFLKRGTLQDVDEFVDQYFEGLDANAMSSALFRQYIMMDGYSAIMKFLKELEYSKEKIDNSFKNSRDINEQLTSKEDCCKFYKTILKEAIDLRNRSSQKKYAGLIEKAKEYIHQKYSMSDLTLDKVASKVNISPNYFSSLFNQETGMTFIEYLTDIRMEKAKEYLRCTGKKITEIGFSVGYLDSHYFSYIFKKTQNCTPSEYRCRGMVKDDDE